MTSVAPRRRRTIVALMAGTLVSLFAGGAGTGALAAPAGAPRVDAPGAQSAAAIGRRTRLIRLRTPAVTTTQITLRWSVTRRRARLGGFRVYLGSRRIATVRRSRRRHTIRGLACGRAYRVGLEGRRSGRRLGRRAVLRVSTAACGPAPGTPAPGAPGSGGGPGAGGQGSPATPFSPPSTPPSVPDKPAAVFLSPTGNDAAPCSPVAPCKTFERGYRVAKAGDQVELAAGAYPGQQEIPVDATKVAAEDVIFRPAAGAAVTIESLDVFGKHVEVRRVTIERDFYAKCDADDVTLRGSKATLFFIRSADNISIVDTEFGPSSDISQVGIVSGEPACEPAPKNVVLDNVYMHDYVNPNTHMECVTLQAFEGLAIRRSRFTRCQDFDVFIKSRAPTVDNRDLLIENSWFDKPAPEGTSAIQTSEPDSGGTYTNVMIRNNSFGGTLTLKPDVGYVNASVLSNVGTRWGGDCGQVTSGYNVWSGNAGCTSTDRQAPTGFVNQAGFDFHLTPTAAAIDRGHPAIFPGNDIDAEARPRGAGPDAGADEAR